MEIRLPSMLLRIELPGSITTRVLSAMVSLANPKLEITSLNL
jgi:hypothetical protein